MDYIVHGILQARMLSLPQGGLPNPGIEPKSPTLQVDSLPAEPQGSPGNSRRSLPRILLECFEDTASLCRLMMQIKIL